MALMASGAGGRWLMDLAHSRLVFRLQHGHPEWRCAAAVRVPEQCTGGTMAGMRGSKVMTARLGGQRRRAEQQVQFTRGHWRREEQAGAIHSAGWWESVTVTWPPAATPPRRSPLLRRALATAVDTLGPPAAELAAATAWRLLGPGHRPRAGAPSPRRRQLPGGTRALPRPGQAP